MNVRFVGFVTRTYNFRHRFSRGPLRGRLFSLAPRLLTSLASPARHGCGFRLRSIGAWKGK